MIYIALGVLALFLIGIVRSAWTQLARELDAVFQTYTHDPRDDPDAEINGDVHSIRRHD